ncbi:MAG: NYN domain-containing protein [bacterium]|nr:NYN domain-containing protein [bacterium]
MKNNKEKVLVIFDGSNFYHILKDKRVGISRTLNYQYGKLAEWLINGREAVAINYYVGIARFSKKDPEKSQKIVSSQQRLFAELQKQNINLIRGYMMENNGIFNEKGVDVKIAVDIVIGAYENLFDTVILISSDTDLIPAIEKAMRLGKKVEYVGLSYRPSFGLMKKVSETKLLAEKDLEKFE